MTSEERFHTCRFRGSQMFYCRYLWVFVGARQFSAGFSAKLENCEVLGTPPKDRTKCLYLCVNMQCRHVL